MMETNHKHIISKEYLLFPTVNCDEQLNKTIKYPYGIHFCWKPMMSHGLGWSGVILVSFFKFNFRSI